MYKHVHDKIIVTATYRGGRPNITSFVWQDRAYDVKQVTMHTKARRGREVVWLYAVKTKTAAFKLRLDTDTMTWFLEEHTWEQMQGN